MPLTSSLLETLESDFPDITFSLGDKYCWSSEDRIIYYTQPINAALLLHEVAHAALGHTIYPYDIDLVKIERDAWEFTSTRLAKTYEAKIDDTYVESMLDTYRNWLHSRSLCPNCEATGIQSAASSYVCLACHETWRVNDARACALRRYKTHQK